MFSLVVGFHISIVVLGLILLGLKVQNDRREKLLRTALYLLHRGR